MALTVTRGDLVEFIRDNGFKKVDPTASRLYDRAIENALRQCSRHRQWSYLTDNTQLSIPAQYATGTVSITHGGTSVTGTGTVFPADVVGAFIQFNGENVWYEVTVRGSDTALTIDEAYRNTGADDLTDVSYSISYLMIDLPARFRTNLRIVDVGRRNTVLLRDVSEQDMASLSNWGGEVGQPYCYAHTHRRHDPNQRSIRLHPAPDSVEIYRMLYTRHAGWYDTNTPATSNFKTKATLDTDYVDWPDDMMDVLEASILYQVARETGDPKEGSYAGAYYQALEAAAGDDEDQGEIRTLGSYGSGPYGQRVYLGEV